MQHKGPLDSKIASHRLARSRALFRINIKFDLSHLYSLSKLMHGSYNQLPMKKFRCTEIVPLLHLLDFTD